MCNALQRRPSAPAQCAVPLGNACSSSRLHTRREGLRTSRDVTRGWPQLGSSQALILALAAAPAAGFSFGNTKTQTYVSPFKDMPGAYGWAAEKGLAYSFGKPFSQQKFPDLVQWVQEAEIKHARVAMLAALGYPVAEVFHPLWGGSINEPSLIAFQATPLQTFWPIVVGAIGLIESASYISDMKGTAEEGRYYAFNEQRGVPGDIGFDPLGFASKGDLRGEELVVGRIAMLGIAGMVAQELNTAGYLFYPDTY